MQVDGCHADLISMEAGSRRYNLRNRICNEHLKALSASVGGVVSRYCQQVRNVKERRENSVKVCWECHRHIWDTSIT